MVDRDNAMLVSPDSGEALGYAIHDLLRDDALRRHIGRNGYRFVRRHHERGAVARQVCQAYERAMAATGKQVNGKSGETSPTPAGRLMAGMAHGHLLTRSA
jgi:hypothetical protein